MALDNQPHLAPKTSAARLTELDLLRFVAAMAVVFYHRIWISPEFPHWATETAKFGYLGVPLFFMISGFVIVWTAADRSTWQFLASRISRLYPSFWGALALTCLLLVVIRGGDDITWAQVAANASMLPTVFQQKDIDPAYWTLTTEWKFYGLVVLLIAFRQMKHAERWFAVWLLICVMCVWLPENFFTRQATLAGSSSYFIAGATLYYIHKKGASPLRLAMFGASALLGVYRAGMIVPGEDSNPLGAAIIVGVLSLVFLALVLRLWSLPVSPLWYWLGALTYPLYLLHYKAGNVVRDWLPPDWTAAQRATVVIALAIAVSGCFVVLIERRVCPAFHHLLLRLPARFRAA